MIPSTPPLSLTAAWAAEYDPAVASLEHNSSMSDGASTKYGEDSDEESDSSSFDLVLARCVLARCK